MALEKQTLVGSIGVNENGPINVRTDTVILDDGVEASRSHSRKVLAPGDPLDGEDSRVVSVANAVWTDEVVSEYQAAQAPAEESSEASE